jgi:glycosyltransferase involved in cell wall biosynthesis
VRVLVDYRSALKGRSGVGEYAHGLVAALASGRPTAKGQAVDVTIFSSSWKDRLEVPQDLGGVSAVDLRIPVTGLNFAWHRLGWPPVELLTRREFDVTHSLHPLLLPSRAAAQVITIHDLNFLSHPERTRAEVRRDYATLARDHAHRADRIIAVSRFTAGEIEAKLGVGPDRISICSPGAPDWRPREMAPAAGYILFLGTLEPRKNIGALLDAYERLLSRQALAPGRVFPDLVLAGHAPPEARPWLEQIARPPLAGRVRHLGYVEPANRRSLYEGASVLVQPSFEEGFGIPVLEAMTVGVPVVAADRGALPEVLGDAGLVVDPTDPEAIAAGLARMVEDTDLSAACAARGIARARGFRWADSAARAVEAYELAIERRTQRLTEARCASA